MDRRQFLKGASAGALAFVFTADAQAQNLGRDYNRQVCTTLSGANLVDYKTQKPYRQDGFVLAYFSTPYKKYEGCETDGLNIARLTQFSTYGANRLNGVLVLSPREGGDPPSSFADAYTGKSGSGNIELTGVTGKKEDVLAVARSYGAGFVIDRKTGRITDHNRSILLIAPDGAMLAKYSSADLKVMADQALNPNAQTDIARRIQDYTKTRLNPAVNCEARL